VPRKKKTEPEAPVEPVVQDEVTGEADGGVAEVVSVAALTQVIVFVMDGQHYALPIEAVQEIQQIVDYTRARGTDPALLGMVDLRGMVVPLIDLRMLLGLNVAPYHLDTPLIFAFIRDRLVALIVDEVEDVIDLTGQELQAPSNLYALADRLTGVVRMGDALLFVLDPYRLVSAETLAEGTKSKKGAAK